MIYCVVNTDEAGRSGLEHSSQLSIWQKRLACFCVASPAAAAHVDQVVLYRFAKSTRFLISMIVEMLFIRKDFEVERGEYANVV